MQFNRILAGVKHFFAVLNILLTPIFIGNSRYKAVNKQVIFILQR